MHGISEVHENTVSRTFRAIRYGRGREPHRVVHIITIWWEWYCLCWYCFSASALVVSLHWDLLLAIDESVFDLVRQHEVDSSFADLPHEDHGIVTSEGRKGCWELRHYLRCWRPVRPMVTLCLQNLWEWLGGRGMWYRIGGCYSCTNS